MEQLKELITAYLPTISSIAAIIISVLTFLSKVKSLVSSSLKENEELKNTIKELTNANKLLGTHTESINEDVNKTISLLKDELQSTQELLQKSTAEINEIKQTKEAYESMSDELKTVKTQLRVLLDDKEK